MRWPCAFLSLLLVVAGAAGTEEMKVPDGCVAAKGAAVSHEGYADRVVHSKSRVELVLVPAGSIDIRTTRATMARPFYVGRTEVTNGQYKKFVKESGYDGGGRVDDAYDRYLAHWRGRSIMPTGNDFPVTFVSWHNARAFCKWAGDLELPTESQWEYACRAGATTSYHFGNEISHYPQHGWATNNSKGRPHKVAGLKPNAWGGTTRTATCGSGAWTTTLPIRPRRPTGPPGRKPAE